MSDEFTTAPEPRPKTAAVVQSTDGIRRITCVCGKVIEGWDDDELLTKAQAHVAADHPDLVGMVSREDILARAEEI